MFIIGIDPHRGSHMAVAIDRDERIVATIELPANQLQRRRLLAWARPLEPRVWAVEGARGTGALLAQQLVAAGEEVIDVAPKLAARVRVLDNTQSDKCDRHDARSVAIAALRKPSLRRVEREDHHDVFRLLAKRHHDLVAGRTCAVCRLVGTGWTIDPDHPDLRGHQPDPAHGDQQEARPVAAAQADAACAVIGRSSFRRIVLGATASGSPAPVRTHWHPGTGVRCLGCQ